MKSKMTGTTTDASFNPIAEKRRQRKLENQRLEAEAKQRQEELRLEKERALKRAENERIAAEQQRLNDLDEQRRKREDALLRIAALEQAERDTISSIENRLQLVGAFCTGEVGLARLSPVCCAVLSTAGLDKPVVGLDDDVVFVSDTSGEIHLYRLRDRRCMFGFRLDPTRPDCTASSMCTARSGQLIVCREALGRLEVFDIAQLMASYQDAPLASRLSGLWYDRSVALTASCSLLKNQTGGFHVGGICIDDTANEIFVSDQRRYCIQVVALNSSGQQRDSQVSLTAKPALLSITRSFGTKGTARGNLHQPAGLDTSHYHVLVCDRGNHRVAVFTKRGVFVCTMGESGSTPGKFLDPRDLKLANVRKRALSRGLTSNENSISNELFDLIVADLGNFRVQILNESGECQRVLSMLSNPEQIQFHRDYIAERWSKILEAFATVGADAPSPHGQDTSLLYGLAQRVHPSTQTYQTITRSYAEIRVDASRFHHPLALAYDIKDREVYIVDRQNTKLFVYSVEGSRATWSKLPLSSPHVSVEDKGLSSTHSILQIGDRLYISDYKSHRVVVLAYASLTFMFYVGAASYGDEIVRSGGYLDGELQSPTYLAHYRADQCDFLLVSDSGNHCVSVFDATTGAFDRRIGSGFGHLPGYLNSPQGLAVYENRWLFVCDQLNHRVQVFELATGEWVRSIGHEQGSSLGEFSFPSAVAICGALPVKSTCNYGPYREAKYCVGDEGNHRVQVFCIETDRVLLVIDTRVTSFEVPMTPSAIVVEERSGYLLVADTANRSIAVYSNDGRFVTAFGSNLEPENCFQRPSGFILTARRQIEADSKLLLVDASRMELCTFELRDARR